MIGTKRSERESESERGNDSKEYRGRGRQLKKNQRWTSDKKPEKYRGFNLKEYLFKR